jgi:acylphosphatase
MKSKFIFKGKKVHDVGYRVLLANTALSLGVNNFNTFNTFIDGAQAVIAVIEGDDKILEEFKRLISTTVPAEAELESVDIEEYEGSIPPIERCMQAFQMEQWGKGIPILVKMLEKQDIMIGKQDIMIGKQDIMIGKQDRMLELQEETIAAIKTEGEKTRDALSAHLSHEIAELREEITHVKSVLTKIMNKVGVSDTL